MFKITDEDIFEIGLIDIYKEENEELDEDEDLIEMSWDDVTHLLDELEIKLQNRFEDNEAYSLVNFFLDVLDNCRFVEFFDQEVFYMMNFNRFEVSDLFKKWLGLSEIDGTLWINDNSMDINGVETFRICDWYENTL